MVELLLKVRFAIKRVFTPILRLAFTPFNDDVRFLVQELLDSLIKRIKPRLVLISLVLNIGNPEDSRPLNNNSITCDLPMEHKATDTM